MLVNAQQPGHMDNEFIFCTVGVYIHAARIGSGQALAIRWHFKTKYICATPFTLMTVLVAALVLPLILSTFHAISKMVHMLFRIAVLQL